MKNITYINAGAGSGKTYTLTETLADKLKEGNYKPSEVILTTFTELAASEFREKARAKLYEHHLPELASQLSAATIGTVHSVALQFIKKYWYLIGVTPDPKVMSEEDMKVYISQSLSSIITPEQLQAINEYVEFFGITENADFWRYDLNALIKKVTAFGINLQESRQQSLNAIASIFTGDNVTLNVTLLDQFRSIVLRDYRTYAPTTQNRLKSYVNSSVSFASIQSTFNYMNAANNTLNQTIKRGIKAEMGEANYDSLATHLQEYLKVAPREWMERMVNTLFDIAELWSKEFNEFKQRNHIIDYDDMERLFLQLLDNEAVAEEIRGTYRLLLVDEFQDSSPIQIEIFKRLAELMDRSYWVGDPKQSIYGFRGTDVELVKDLVDNLNKLKGTDGIEVKTLEKSWRSRPELVKLASECFTRAYDGILAAEQVQLSPERKVVQGLGYPLVHWSMLGSNKDTRANQLAVRVSQLLQSGQQVMDKDSEQLRDLQAGDVAILCRKNDDIKPIVQSLKAAGVPVAIVNQDITQQTEVRMIIALLNMVITPTNKHVRAELLHLMDDRPTQDILCDRLDYLNQLDNLEENDRKDNWQNDNALILRLLTYCKRLSNLSVSDTVQSLVYGLELNELVAKWGDRKDRQQNLYSLVDLARAYDEYCVNLGIGAAIGGFINYLLANEVEAKVDNTANAVKVLTYHKAKGLEWNYVILTSLQQDALAEQEFAKKSFWGMCELRQSDNSYLIQYLPRIWNKGNIDTSIITAIKALPSYHVLFERTTNEWRNLLYVGVTRARDYLATTGQSGRTLNWVANAGISAGNPNDLWNYNALQPECEVLETDSNGYESSATSQRVTYNEHVAISNAPKYLLPSMLTLDEGQMIKVELAASLSNNRMEHGRVGEDQEATFGTCLHNIFAVYDPTVPHEENIARAKRIRDGYFMYEIIPDLGQVIESIELLYQHLTNTYGAAVRVEHEVPFVHVLDGQEVHGEIDLLWYTADDTCVLVDFKNFPGKESSLLDPADDKHYAGLYAPQLNAYRDVLTQSGCKVADTLIYYSVLRTLVRLRNCEICYEPKPLRPREQSAHL